MADGVGLTIEATTASSEGVPRLCTTTSLDGQHRRPVLLPVRSEPNGIRWAYLDHTAAGWVLSGVAGLEQTDLTVTIDGQTTPVPLTDVTVSGPFPPLRAFAIRLPDSPAGSGELRGGGGFQSFRWDDHLVARRPPPADELPGRRGCRSAVRCSIRGHVPPSLSRPPIPRAEQKSAAGGPGGCRFRTELKGRSSEVWLEHRERLGSRAEGGLPAVGPDQVDTGPSPCLQRRADAADKTCRVDASVPKEVVGKVVPTEGALHAVAAVPMGLQPVLPAGSSRYCAGHGVCGLFVSSPIRTPPGSAGERRELPGQ